MIALLAVAATALAGPVFVEGPCEGPVLTPRMRCGTVSVPEDRAQPSGRTIPLNIVIIAAAEPGPERHALFDLDGGPGLADTKNVGFYATDGIGYAEKRDLVLIDQRGTGGSNPLDCPEFDAADRALKPIFPQAAVRACREKLERSADLTLYTTDDAVADIDAVRAALGYARIDLMALSYGTTLALRYIALHEANVRSAVLLSTVPPTAMPPRHHAEAAQAALAQLFADCAADSSCRAAYPDLPGDLDEAARRLRAGGQVDPAIMMERLRTKLYSAEGTRELPWMIHRLAGGDASVLKTNNERAGFNYFDGLYLAITCAESLPWFDETGARATARATPFGDYRLARQRAACDQWPVAAISADFFAPVQSSVPTLFVSGGRDPVTPADWAAETARGFSKGRRIVIRWAGHVIDGLSNLDSCFDPQIIRFLDTADASAVDDGCFAAMMPPPFRIVD